MALISFGAQLRLTRRAESVIEATWSDLERRLHAGRMLSDADSNLEGVSVRQYPLVLCGRPADPNLSRNELVSGDDDGLDHAVSATDFVDPIAPGDPLPQPLHVGYSEAMRLLGPDPSVGPLAQLIDWVHDLSSEQIDLIHIRDWHDPDDAAQREHLRRFGAHCLQGSAGARLVLGMDERAFVADNAQIIERITLNDFQGTDLVTQLERIRETHCGESLRVGVIGVWTEAKVSFLLYDLKILPRHPTNRRRDTAPHGQRFPSRTIHGPPAVGEDPRGAVF